MKNVIALWGRQNSGKTTTIKLAKDTLLSKHGFQEHETIHNGVEYIGILVFEGKLVGICTVGDLREEMEKYYNLLIQKKCEFIIGACRTRGKTVQYIETFPHTYIQKSTSLSSGGQISDNAHDSKEIVKALLKFI